MGIFDRMRGWFRPGEGDADDEDDPATAAPEREAAPRAGAAGPPRDDAATAYDGLARVGLSGGPSTDEAIALLRRARGTSDEGLALDRALSSIGERAVPE